jgi:hypothetical protein
MKKITARLNLVLIFILFGGGLYVHYKKVSPFYDFIDNMLDYISSTIGSGGLTGIYYIFLLVTLFTVFTSLYAAFEGNESKEYLLEKEVALLKDEKDTYERERLELMTDVKKHSSQNDELRIMLENSVEKEAHERLATKVSDLEESYKQQSEELSGVKEALNSAEAEKLAREAEVSTATSENKKIKKELTEARKKLEQAEEAKQEFAEQRASLNAELEQVKEELGRANANLKGGREAVPPAAYQIFYLLQKEGRFVDMLHENIEEYDDETLGGAFRKLHEDLQALFAERFILEPVLKEEEGSEVTLEALDTELVKVSGKVPSEGPYVGELIHKGWRLTECRLPEMVEGWKGDVIAQAEIEI